MKTGLSKYNVNPPNKDIIIPPTKGINGIFFSKKYIPKTATKVAIISGGIATLRLFPLL